ncbi:MAG: cob(I)yrinic acid a,c-diamide adenosyltransferase, partial [Rhodospirillales bacterium]|nr:cob(I)yrinic acid a,c-diamide adenosyltransferase [Rhodospirillales bacterium]
GKSTAAFGLALRAIGNGMKVGVVQFVKGQWGTGERTVLEKFPDQVTIKALGEGFSWETQDRERDIRAAEAAWAAAKEMIDACRGDNPAYDMVVLDELNIPLRYDHLDGAAVVDFLKGRPPMLHVVVTGRNASEAMIEAADLVTEMGAVKHPFRDGVKAQKGIEF